MLLHNANKQNKTKQPQYIISHPKSDDLVSSLVSKEEELRLRIFFAVLRKHLRDLKLSVNKLKILSITRKIEMNCFC